MGKITFILGGSKSGKSRYAAELAGKSGIKRVAFIATGEAKDGEMAMRIAVHRKERPAAWKTFEEPRRVVALLKRLGSDYPVVIIDCLTLLISNLLLEKRSAKFIEEEIKNIFNELHRMRSRAIIVSNEVGLGIVPANRLARDFRDIAGSVNKIAAGMSDEVIFIVSGIPWRIK